MTPTLHGYYRSTAAWRVRIGLNLKGVAADHVFHHLRRGEQRAPDYLRLNPQGLLPAFETDGAVLTQSLAILEYLEEAVPQPSLLPAEPLEQARVRAFALAVACDIHPVQNLKVLARLRGLGLGEDAVQGWARGTIAEGLAACEALVRGRGRSCSGPCRGSRRSASCRNCSTPGSSACRPSGRGCWRRRRSARRCPLSPTLWLIGNPTRNRLARHCARTICCTAA